MVNNADNIDIDLWRAGKPEGLKLMNEKTRWLITLIISILTCGGPEGLQLMKEITRRLIMLIISSYGLRSKYSCTKSYFRILVARQLERGQKN